MINYRYALTHLLATTLGALALMGALHFAGGHEEGASPPPLPAVESQGWGQGACAEDEWCALAADGTIISRAHTDIIHEGGDDANITLTPAPPATPIAGNPADHLCC